MGRPRTRCWSASKIVGGSVGDDRRLRALLHHGRCLGFVGATIGVVAWLAADVALALLFGICGVPSLVAVGALAISAIAGSVAGLGCACPVRRPLMLALLASLASSFLVSLHRRHNELVAEPCVLYAHGEGRRIRRV